MDLWILFLLQSFRGFPGVLLFRTKYMELPYKIVKPDL